MNFSWYYYRGLTYDACALRGAVREGRRHSISRFERRRPSRGLLIKKTYQKLYKKLIKNLFIQLTEL